MRDDANQKAPREAGLSGRDEVPCDHLDDGIRNIVIALNGAGIETFESCEGGKGHAFSEPTVRFYGGRSEGYRAYAAASEIGLSVVDLRRVWPVVDGELTGPWWEMTFQLVS